MSLKLTWDEAKRRATLNERGIDFADARELFAGLHFTAADRRRDYGEDRFISAGLVGGRLCIVVWTRRENARRIISMRKGNAREQKSFKAATEDT
jgi:hypothetical protein